ncbi:MAG TPA: c-type cytochrome [Bryobacteraceae bacterium]|nr:c-type cytochrome [Bryobacteraceae bacterium]
MRNKFGIVSIAIASLLMAGTAFAADLPNWAYGFAGPGTPPPATPAAPDTSVKHLPGSKGEFTRAQISDRFGPADWYPEDHPSMPPVVAYGKKPNVFACSLCHYPNGKGRPENAGVSGLPVDYFIQTMKDFRDGNRKSTDMRKANTNLMIQFAKNMTDEEIRQAAEYFGGMKWTTWMRVMETNTVPKTRIAGGMFLTIEGGGTEPLGKRIIETPVNVEGTEVLRDDHSGFIVYAPVGSVKKGEALVTKGGAGKTTRCGACHGENLEGLGPVPGLAGRSPSYLVRQLYDMQQGTRKGEWTELMKPVVAKLTNDDMIDIAAYLASRMP